MPYLTFAEYVAHRDEGLWLPNTPIVKNMGKINVLPITQARRNRLMKAPQQVRPASPNPIPSPTAQYMKAISRAFE